MTAQRLSKKLCRLAPDLSSQNLQQRAHLVLVLGKNVHEQFACVRITVVTELRAIQLEMKSQNYKLDSSQPDDGIRSPKGKPMRTRPVHALSALPLNPPRLPAQRMEQRGGAAAPSTAPNDSPRPSRSSAAAPWTRNPGLLPNPDNRCYVNCLIRFLSSQDSLLVNLRAYRAASGHDDECIHALVSCFPTTGARPCPNADAVDYLYKLLQKRAPSMYGGAQQAGFTDVFATVVSWFRDDEASPFCTFDAITTTTSTCSTCGSTALLKAPLGVITSHNVVVSASSGGLLQSLSDVASPVYDPMVICTACSDLGQDLLQPGTISRVITKTGSYIGFEIDRSKAGSVKDNSRFKIPLVLTVGCGLPNTTPMTLISIMCHRGNVSRSSHWTLYQTLVGRAAVCGLISTTTRLPGD